MNPEDIPNWALALAATITSLLGAGKVGQATARKEVNSIPLAEKIDFSPVTDLIKQNHSEFRAWVPRIEKLEQDVPNRDHAIRDLLNSKALEQVKASTLLEAKVITVVDNYARLERQIETLGVKIDRLLDNMQPHKRNE